MNIFNQGKHSFCVICSVFLISACANVGPNHRVLVDGGDLTNYETDLSACQDLASTRGYVNGETKADSAIGAGVGMLSNASDGFGNAVAGAAVGALVGGAFSSLGARQEMKNIVIKCMQGRGYNTVEAVETHQ